LYGRSTAAPDVRKINPTWVFDPKHDDHHPNHLTTNKLHSSPPRFTLSLPTREALVFENVSRRQNAPQRRLAFGDLPIPGTKAGAIVSAGLVIIAWLAIPVAHVFILGTVGLGALVGLGLSWWHSRE
jgi:hypothetical protein